MRRTSRGLDAPTASCSPLKSYDHPALLHCRRGRHCCLCRWQCLFRFVVLIADLHRALQLRVLRIGQRGDVLHVLCHDNLILSLEEDFVPLRLLAYPLDDASLRSLLQLPHARVAVDATRRSGDDDVHRSGALPFSTSIGDAFFVFDRVELQFKMSTA